ASGGRYAPGARPHPPHRNHPDNPPHPQRPDQPHQPDQPQTPDHPDQPSQPDQPNQPDQPQQPDQSDQPQQPDQPDQPDDSKPLGRKLSDYLQDKGSTLIREAPSSFVTHMNTGIINTLNDELTKSGQPLLVLDQANAFRADVTKAVSPVAQALGLHVQDNLQIAVQQGLPDDLRGKMDQATLSSGPNYNLNLGMGVFSVGASGHS